MSWLTQVWGKNVHVTGRSVSLTTEWIPLSTITLWKHHCLRRRLRVPTPHRMRTGWGMLQQLQLCTLNMCPTTHLSISPFFFFQFVWLHTSRQRPQWWDDVVVSLSTEVLTQIISLILFLVWLHKCLGWHKSRGRIRPEANGRLGGDEDYFQCW